MTLVADLRLAREARDRLADVVEALRHHGTAYRWHEQEWNRALLLADSVTADYRKHTQETSHG